jgi:protein phosphatase
MKISSVTHPGLEREDNEDRFLVKQFNNGSTLLALADGMGGLPGGEQAAQIAKESLDGFIPDSRPIRARLVELIQEAHGRILEAGAKEAGLKGMGTTATAAFVSEGVAHWVHVGDSRLYLFRRDELVRITKDHTVPGILLSTGRITEEEARLHPMRNLLLRCVGCEYFQADIGTFEVQKGDLILLSSDGMHDEVPEQRILRVLKSESGLEEKLNALVLAALEAGGRDNITVVGAET